MALKVALDTLDGLDEAQQSLYTEQDGKFYLQLEGVDDHPDVANLRNAYQSEKTKRQDQGQKLAETQARLAELEAKPNPTKTDDAEILKLRETLEGERDTWKTKATELERTVYSLTVDSQLDAAIREVGVSEPAFQKAAKRMLSDGVKVVDGNPVFDTDMGPLGLSEYVKRWASGDGAAFVSKPAGGGASGGKGAASKSNPMLEKVPQLADLPEK